MILVLADYPNAQNEKDGMFQRIAAIDLLFGKTPRCYIPTTKNRNKLSYFIKHPLHYCKTKLGIDYIKPHPEVKVYRNIKQTDFAGLAAKADFIYAHSLHYLLHMPLELIKQYGHKIIVDIHGCVVEEVEFNGFSQNVLELFAEVERTAFAYVKNFIAVSDNMIDFYKNKYPQTPAHFIKLPIFNPRCNHHPLKQPHDKLSIIYAGGVQKWQNIDLMIDLIKKTANKYAYIFLTGNTETVKDLIDDTNVLDNIFLASVASDEVFNYYLQADLGLLLRDDNIVNRVACPTKAIEYLEQGVVPVVLQPEIGDLNRMGYQYVLNSDLENGSVPNFTEIAAMREHNYQIYEKFKKYHQSGKDSLINLFAEMLS